MKRKKILVVDDDRLIRWSLREKLEAWNYDVVESETAKSGRRAMEEELPDIVMLDVKLPDGKGTEIVQEFRQKWPETPVIMMTAFGVIEDVVTAMRNGAYDFITKPIDFTRLEQTLKNACETVHLRKEIAVYKEKERKAFDPSRIVAVSKTMKHILEMIQKIAASRATIVLLEGESGTGKDLLAQAIHAMSERHPYPYLAINCSAIPENLLESELFGYEKGAFTDAKQRKQGLAEVADGGTLFLDEISTLNLHLQAKLLRFLETQTFKRVGGLKDIQVDLRVIAATNQDLEACCREGKFREDLYYRLNVCPVLIPPLRERRCDIIPLAEHFVSEYNLRFRKNIRGLNPEVQDLFLKYDWPGNARELKNAVERAMIFENGPYITPEYLPISLKSPLPKEKGRPGQVMDLKIASLPEVEREMLIRALEKAGGNKAEAARILRISRDTLRYRLKKYSIQT